MLQAGWYHTITIINSFVTINGLIEATSLKLQENSVLSGNKLEIKAGAVYLETGSRIDVSGRGYGGGYGKGSGRTLGNTTTGGSAWRNGGSYGGLGGSYSGAVNTVYGDATDPNEYGSGGGGYYYSGWSYYYYTGGSGGGLIRLNAAKLQLDGEILANGAAGSSTAGGGSGGGIWINAETINGNGTISAQGGSASGGGAGGGGRIAIYYGALALPAENILASGGKQTDSYSSKNGGAGTVYLKDQSSVHGDLIVDGDGVNTARQTILSDLTLRNLEARNKSNIKFAEVVTVENELVISDVTGIEFTGTLLNDSDLVISSSNGTLKIGSEAVLPDNLTLSGGAMTLSGSLAITGTLRLQKDATLSAGTLAAQAATIIVETGSRIDVSGRGYGGGYGKGSGRTLGNTTTGGSAWRNGGSYGGLGGSYSGAVNTVYGDATDPNEYGSGGGGYYYSGWSYYYYTGGSGGGLIRLNAATLQLDGEILANGAAGSSTTGGGSGGGIWINAETINGNGTISAQGGSASGGGAGGGGRIAVYYDMLNFPTQSILASGGYASSSYSSRNGGAGTIYLKSSTAEYGDLILDNNGISTTRTTPIPGILLARLEVKGGARLEYSDKTAPHITGASIAEDVLDISVSTILEVYFDEALDSATVNGNSVMLTDSGSGNAVAGKVELSSDRKTILFTPNSLLEEGRRYLLTVTTGVSDLSHNVLATPYQLPFTTEFHDTAPPLVRMTFPAEGEITRRNDIVIFILEDDYSGVDEMATTASASVIGQDGLVIAGDWQWSGDKGELAFVPLEPFAEGSCSVTIHPTDLAGNSTVADLSFTILDPLADADGVVSRYTMENISGGLLVDERGRFDGTIFGAVQTADGGGVLGEALEFAPGQYVTIPKGVLSADQFGIAFFEHSPSDAFSANGYLLGDGENPLNFFFRRYPLNEVDGATYACVVGNTNFGQKNLEAKIFPRDQFNFIVINKFRDGRVNIFVNDIDTPEAAGTGSNFNDLISDLWLGNRADLQRDYVGRLDQFTIGIRPFGLTARLELLGEGLDLDYGLVAKYTMNDIIGNVVKDVMGNSDGIIVGASPTPDESGQTLHFVATENDRVEIPAGISDMIQGTIAIFAKPGNVDSGVLLSNLDADMRAGMFQLDFKSGGYLRMLVHDGEIWSTEITALTSLLPDEQALITITWNEEGKKIYLNDQEAASTLNSQSLFDANTSTIIGNQYDVNQGFDGYLEELRVYDRTLTPQEIIFLYNSR